MSADLELATHLATAGLGLTLGTSVFAGQIPAGVTVLAAGLVQYPGQAPELTCGSDGMTIEFPRVQVTVRPATALDADVQAALTLAKNIAVALSRIKNQSLSSVRYRSVNVIQSPGLLYRDDNDLPIQGFNVEAEKEPS